MITFVSSNAEKRHFAAIELGEYGIAYEFVDLAVLEIQSDNPRAIVEAKAKSAFEQLHKPVVVSDHFWQFPALNGFPGAYMKYVNDWLTSQQLLRLFDGESDRRALLTDSLCFYDGRTLEVFSEEIPGVVLPSPEGNGLPGQEIVSLSEDGHSIAYHLNHQTDPRGEDKRLAWKKLAQWYDGTQSTT